MSLQEIFDIAVRHQTYMADRMVNACVARALRNGERLRSPKVTRATEEVMYVDRD